MILEQINGPEELKALPPEDLKILAQEIRTFLIEKISHTGGHLASNLGVVELTIALFKTLNLPEDKVIWDVGHQSYTHKILSGRMAEFDELRQYGGLSGFPKRKESPYDSFDTGHSSTSISAGLGIALGRDIRGEDYRVVSVIGDGALTGGMAYEALNNAARMKKNFIIVLNDNKMSISENVGGMSRYLNGLRTGSGYNDLKKSVADALDRIPVVGTAMIDKIKRTKNSIKQLFIPGMLFENMGITYLGPVDGHNIQALCKVLRETQKLDHAVLVHVMTKKGKGYRPAEKNPSYFHGVGPFDIKTGQSLSSQKNPSYTDVFSRKLCQLGQEHPELVTVRGWLHLERSFRTVFLMWESRRLMRSRLLQAWLRPGSGPWWRSIPLSCRGPMTRSCTMSVSRTCRCYLQWTGQGLWVATGGPIRASLTILS